MKYIKEFDTLRAFAVMAVMFGHYLSQYIFLSYFASAGVTLFFVLSGFLITNIILKEKENFNSSKNPEIDISVGKFLKTFYIRRSLRIFPIYFITLIVVAIFNIDSSRIYFGYYALYLSNFLYSFIISFDRLAHFWSLAVEEQFYIIWPVIILLLPKFVRKSIFFCIAIAFSLAFKFFVLLKFPYSVGYLFLMPSCIESFASGALALILSEKYSNLNPRGILLFSLSIYIILQIIGFKNQSVAINIITKIFSRLIFSTFAASLLIIIKNGQENVFFKKILTFKPLMYIGKISYGIYIYHLFVPRLVTYIEEKLHFSLAGSGLNLISFFIVTFLMAHFSFILIEKPINNLKNQFNY